MFADVAGSTRLYETLGDSKAQEAISQCLTRMSEITNRYGGIVIKTIGDEIMCRFATADDAVNAGINIQEVLESDSTVGSVPLSVRIGMHYGPAILQSGDVFGDAVNVAARMAGIAKACQIITTEETVKHLSPDLEEMTRQFDKASVKGKQDEIVIYEVLWEQDDVTRMAGFASAAPAVDMKLNLRVQDAEKSIGSDTATFVLGRGSQCDLMVPANLASRMHARIEYRRGKFVLIDQSTNGTYVRTQDGREVFLRREELPLTGAGVISLGEPVKDANPASILYMVQ